MAGRDLFAAPLSKGRDLFAPKVYANPNLLALPGPIGGIAAALGLNGMPQIDNGQPWQEPGSIVPVQFQEGTGKMRGAVPGLVSDLMKAIEAPGKAASGEYGIEIDEVTGRPTPITNDMIGDTVSLATMGVGGVPAAAGKAASTAALKA